VLDFQPVELAQMVDIPQVLLPRVLEWDAEDLVVAALLILHPEHADGPAPDEASWERRLLHQDQRVQRVAIGTERFLDEAVVRRVLRCCEQRAVQPYATGGVIHLVLVSVTFRDLNRYVEIHLTLPNLAAQVS